MNSIKEMMGNTLNFIGSPLGIFILILLAIIIAEALIIWLLIWIIKNQFSKNKGENNQQVKGGIQ